MPPTRLHRRAFLVSIAALALLLPRVTGAAIKLPAIFGNHMVLQQNQPDRIWGWAEPGEQLVVTFAEQTHETKAGADGKWQVTLQPLPAGGPHVLTIRGSETITLNDVLVGEVWICSGQSNMAWAVQQSNDADLEIRTANFPQIRLISVPQVGTQEPQTDFQGQWKVCSPETVGDFSGVGYFFGRQLHQTLHVPIGLIDNAWGGSACEAWIRRDLLAADERYQPLLERWAGIEKNYDHEKAMAQFRQQQEAHRDAVAKAKAEGKQPPQPPRPPQNLLRGNARPANIYNGVLKPTIGYGIRGAIWYQGESNAGRAYQYRELFPLMIRSWREEWQQGDFPFYWVQLADFRMEKPQPEESDWAELREAQTMTMERLPRTGQAVIIDAGEAQDIHPRNKQVVAMRLARWALAKDYGLSLAHRSPQYESLSVEGGKVRIKFAHVGSGLKAFDVAELQGFAVAGADRKFVWASGKVIADDQVEVSSPDVAEPVAVRYAWADNPVCNLYSKEGLPVTPFRSDDWPGVTANNAR